jgi:hypothetical protein
LDESEFKILLYNTTILVFFLHLGVDGFRRSLPCNLKTGNNYKPCVAGPLRKRVAQIAPAPRTVAASPNTMDRVSLMETDQLAVS